MSSLYNKLTKVRLEGNLIALFAKHFARNIGLQPHTNTTKIDETCLPESWIDGIVLYK